jgi:GNAT superfamily N-acetyltransferase
MKITFQTTPPPIEDTDRFDAVYPEGLQVDREEREKIFNHGYGVWLLVNGELAGEMYGLPSWVDDEGIPDMGDEDFYIGSFTILPEYQRKGLGKLLFAYTLAGSRESFQRISLHATSEGMNLVSDFFGLKTGPRHANWFGTGRSALFRYLDLP